AAIVRLGARDAPLVETRTVSMRYRGQGHEVVVSLPSRELDSGDVHLLSSGFEKAYRNLYGRIIPNLTPEAMSFSLRLGTDRALPERIADIDRAEPSVASATRRTFDAATESAVDIPVFRRSDLPSGAEVRGPAFVVEDETSTFVTAAFVCRVNA